VGFAISRLDAEEADRTLRILKAMGLLESEERGAP
jgi:hydrogenase maturation factor